jgi:hypothetical protein
VAKFAVGSAGDLIFAGNDDDSFYGNEIETFLKQYKKRSLHSSTTNEFFIFR